MSNDNQDSAEFHINIYGVDKVFKISPDMFVFLSKKFLTPVDYDRREKELWHWYFDLESKLYFGVYNIDEMPTRFTIFTQFSWKDKVICDKKEEPPFLHVNINGEEKIFKISKEMSDFIARKLLRSVYNVSYKEHILEKGNVRYWYFEPENELKFSKWEENEVTIKLIISDDRLWIKKMIQEDEFRRLL